MTGSDTRANAVDIHVAATIRVVHVARVLPVLGVGVLG